MERHLIERRPTWWLLYAFGLALVGIVWLIETSVPAEGPRTALEGLAVVAIFGMMLRWLRANRARIELAEAAETRRAAIEATLVSRAPAGSAGRPGSASRRAW